jgi:hypothetical protein
MRRTDEKRARREERVNAMKIFRRNRATPESS